MKPSSTGRNECGFTMLEVLVAGGILAGALLALSGLQAASFSKNVDSKESTVATNLGAEMVERIQSNRQKVLDYNNIDTTSGTPCPQSATTQRQAKGDCNQWRTALANSGLNGVRGTVAVAQVDPDPKLGTASINRSTVVVMLRWNALGKAPSMTFRAVIAPE